VPTKVESKKKIDIIQARNLSKYEWLVHGFSTRRGGYSKVYGGEALNLGITEQDTAAAVERNRKAFMKAVGAQRMTLLTLRQVHSDIIHCLDSAPKQPLAGDGIITRHPGLLLSVRTADCYPIIIVDPEHRAVGVFHAGWRGTLKRLAEKGVGEMRRWFGSRPEQLQAAIGPGIGQCCYKVSEELREKFIGRFSYGEQLFTESEEYDEVKLRYPMLFLTARAPGHSHGLFPKAIHLDLAQANRMQLLEAGLLEKSISVAGACTACKVRRFFSHRKEKGVTGRMMAVAGIRGTK